MMLMLWAAKGTAKALEYIMKEWLNENAVDSVKEATIAAAQEEVKTLLDEVRGDMMNEAKKKLITHNRAINLIKEITKMKIELETGKYESGKKKDQPLPEEVIAKYEEKIPQYEGRIKALLDEGVIDAAGNVIMGNLDFDNWQASIGTKIQKKLKAVLAPELAQKGQATDSSLSLRDVLVDEVLSGRRIFKDAPDAVAHYIVSPDHVFSLVPGDGAGYKKTLATFGSLIKLRVASKGGRPITDDGRLASVGVKPAYRFDIKGKHIEAAFEKVEKEFVEAQERQAAAAIEAGEDFEDVEVGADVPSQPASIDEAEADSAEIKEFEENMDDIIQDLGQALVEQFVQALDIEETAASMTGGED